ncbi:hypothetical protein CTAYLR_006391 [Chrysophaeum taylorii]|uniref:Uncharacterized protein n=1 Tax=Chrysophaeum taylorii TaxID=2483200 RepID=A0AAD7XFD1_9STRA|nr:hypothetical protein CTAYLR_006391 [Chrysophaeum taylorii]
MTTCMWVNSTLVTSVISDAVDFMPGSNVTLLGGVLGAMCANNERCECYKSANEMTIDATGPANAIVPRSVFQGPALVSVCDNFTLRADQSTGSGGRKMTYFWSAAAATKSAMLAAAVDRAQGNSFFDLSNSELDEIIVVTSLLEITLSLTNFLEVNTTSSYSTRLTYDRIPSLVIIGGASTILASRSEALSIEAEGFATNCDGRAAFERQVDFFWTLFEEQPDDGSLLRTDYVSIANNKRFFKLNAFAEPGVFCDRNPYTFHVVCVTFT